MFIRYRLLLGGLPLKKLSKVTKSSQQPKEIQNNLSGAQDNLSGVHNNPSGTANNFSGARNTPSGAQNHLIEAQITQAELPTT